MTRGGARPGGALLPAAPGSLLPWPLLFSAAGIGVYTIALAALGAGPV